MDLKIGLIGLFGIIIVLSIFVVDIQRKLQMKPNNCLERVEYYCYNLHGSCPKYNDCKWKEFPKRCPEECLDYFSHLLEEGFEEEYQRRINKYCRGY